MSASYKNIVASLLIFVEITLIGHELLIRFAHKYSRPRLGSLAKASGCLRLSILRASYRSLHLPSTKNARVKRAVFYTSGDGENRTRVQKMFKKESTRAYPVLIPLIQTLFGRATIFYENGLARRVLDSTSIKQATPCIIDPLCFEIVSRRYDLYSEMYITRFPYRTSEKTNAV